jgi:hypothetical protein
MGVLEPVHFLRVILFVMKATVSSVGSMSGVRSPESIMFVSAGNFHLVLGLFNSLVVVLLISLLLGHSLVIGLHLEHGVLLLHGGLIFEHSSHASDSVSLVGVGLFFSAISVLFITVFTLLLLNPLFLSVLVLLHSVLVVKVLSLKLTDTRDVHGDILGGSVESLSGTFH